MIKVTQGKEPNLKLHQGDMRSYNLQKSFETILILSSTLVLLQNNEEIGECLQRTYEHLTPGGMLFLELPNHLVEVKNSEGTQEVHTNEDRSIVVVIQSSKTDNCWREAWHIFRAGSEGFERTEVMCDEFLYSPDRLEEQLAETGFKIVERYGDLLGSAFDEATSWRRVLICKKP